MLNIRKHRSGIALSQKEHLFKSGAPSARFQGHRSSAAFGLVSPLRSGFGERMSENGN